jgi:hypothetical protein
MDAAFERLNHEEHEEHEEANELNQLALFCSLRVLRVSGFRSSTGRVED